MDENKISIFYEKNVEKLDRSLRRINSFCAQTVK